MRQSCVSLDGAMKFVFIPAKISFDNGMCTDSLITLSCTTVWKQYSTGQVDVVANLQNRTFECKIVLFSDKFAPKSPISDQSPRKSDLVGTLIFTHSKPSLINPFLHPLRLIMLTPFPTF